MTYSESQKKATYNWRNKNREHYNEYMVKPKEKYYKNNIKALRTYGVEYYHYKREFSYPVVAKIFLKILR